MSIYKCKHFGIKELVSEGTYNKRGEKAWQLLDDRILRTIDFLRETYGSIQSTIGVGVEKTNGED